MKRQRRGLLPSFDPPCRCARSIFFAAERHFRRGSRPAAAGGRRRQDAISAAAAPVFRGGRDVEGAVLIFPQGAGRRGRRPLHTQSAGSRFQGRRLPPLRESLFGGWKLPSLYNGGEILKRGYPPLEAFQLGRVKGGEEIAIFPSLVSFSFPLSLGQARERGSLRLTSCS